MSSNPGVQRPCPHVRQDLACSCSAGDEQPNSEHHAQCLRQGWPCGERCQYVCTKTIDLTEAEVLAIIDWIREGDSRWTIRHVTAVLKRLVGGG